jgi:polyhydroxyalkanoate synthase
VIRDRVGQLSWRGVTPCQTVTETALFSLLAFGEGANRGRCPVLICYSNVNRAYILDFLPRLSVIEQFVRVGLAVYLIDWKRPHSATLGLKDYADQGIRDAADCVRDRTGAEAVHLFGYCWGGVFAAVYAALHPGQPASLTLLAAPIDCANQAPTTVEAWARRPDIDPAALADHSGFVPGRLITRILFAANPLQLGVAKLYELLECGHDPRLTRSFFDGQRWLHDAPPVAGRVFVEMIRGVYQRNQLARGELTVNGRKVRLAAIRCPVLSVVGDRDDLVSPACSLKIGELVSSPPSSVHTFQVPTGHVGLTCGKAAHTQAWPKVAHVLASL